LLAGRIVERVAQDREPPGVWLDVGFGNGSLLFVAEEWGYDAVGIDLRAENVAGLQALGLEAHRCELAELDHDERYSVMSMADVLEHMPYPKAALEAARRLLNPGGLLLISLPNAGTMPWHMLTKAGANPYMGEIEHYHNFSRKRLTALLSETGFDPVKYAVSERYRLGMEVIARRAT
ncbi:MAG: class I SAM-dependent methyltransferase, partial [Rhodospirillaceae bacterium]